MVKSKLTSPIKLCKQLCVQYSVFVQYAKPWPHSDIISDLLSPTNTCFTSRYDSTLLGCAFFTLKVLLHEIIHTATLYVV